MALDRHIARLAKILVDSDGVPFEEAQSLLRALTLEIVVAPDAVSPAAHAAILTAVSAGRRTFVGGVRVVGALDQPLNSSLPLSAATLREAVIEVGAATFDGPASRCIIVGTVGPVDAAWSISVWWDGWRAGTDLPGAGKMGIGDNPLAGNAAAALAIGAAFEAARGRPVTPRSEINLWPTTGQDQAPSFMEVFLPGALWLIGLGNLGQAFLWALAALPYSDPAKVTLVLQDRDRVTEENWSTSVLVTDETYGALKTKVGEQWAEAKKFEVRRIDRRLVDGDHLADDDPRVALSGVDKIEVRKLMAQVGFNCIVDAGLGRTASDFDKFRVSVFDHTRPIDKHFSGQTDRLQEPAIPEDAAYQALEAEIGRCGTAEIAGASVAAPYVSALAAAVAVSRLIAVTSGCECPPNEVGRVSALSARRVAPNVKIDAREAGHAGRPIQTRNMPEA